MWERFCKIRKKLRIYGRFQLFSTNFVNNLGRMPVPPTTWGAHTSYYVGCVVWQGALPPTVWVRGMGRMPIPPNI